MHGDLSAAEIEQLLRSGFLARLGCCESTRPYVVPVCYAYDGAFIYGFSGDGEKLEALRSSRQVCVQVDRIADPANWRSVLVWGTFEELRGTEALDALQQLSRHLVAAAGPEHAFDPRTFVTRNRGFGVAYRIRVYERSGRYESRS